MKNMKTASMILGLSLFSAMVATSAQANPSCSWPRQYGHGNMSQFLNNRNQHPCQPAKPTQPSSPSTPAQTLQCGEQITANTTLTQDLLCPTTTGFALQVIGNNITLNGNGHKIVAPLAAAGVYVQGQSDTVKNIKVNGAQTYGIFAYDAPGISILNNDVSGNSIGIEIYAESTHITNALVQGNIAHGNSVFGLRTSQDGVGTVDSPSIRLNDFSQSGSYAIVVDASNYEMDGSALNILYNSANGLYLSGGTFYIHDLTMSLQMIQNTEIFGETAASVTIKNCDLSTFLKALATETHNGVDLYRVTEFQISGLIAANQDIGVRLETEQEISPAGSISGCSFSNNQYAGISIISYDGTHFGKVSTSGNRYCEKSTAQDVVIDPNTYVAQ